MKSTTFVSRWAPMCACLAVAGWCGVAPVSAQEGETLTEDGVISGTMNIDFKTRTTPDTSGDLAEGSPAKGAQDEYNFALQVAKTTEFAGSITRLPNLYSKTLRKLQQSAMLGFHIKLAVMSSRNPSEKKTIGNWVGSVPINTQTGAYDLAGGKAANDSPLRIAVESAGKVAAFTDHFSGRLIGKAEKKENLAGYTYKRLIGKKTVEVKVARSDPMRFENIELAKGPVDAYPRTTVNGRLDYDYETGNWLTDGIRFRYSANGKDFEDIVTGSIRWIEDPNRATNGKGYYEFNLRFNEEKNKSAGGESAAFEEMNDEEAFFAIDNAVPALTGRINYEDVMVSGKDVPASSKVTFALNANKLTKQQVMNFFKLWMICAGPTNDE